MTASGAVIRAADVRADRAVAGASMRTLFDCGPAGTRLGRRLVEVASGSVLAGTAGNSGELWFVIAGRGRLELAGHRGLGLHADQGLWLPPGTAYRAHAEGQGELRLDVVTLPATSAGQQSEPLSRNLDDCAVETTGDRRFRVLFGPGLGCRVATQFVGEIPPGRAPDHSHPYDEVVLVLEGEGLVHMAGAGHPIAAGACVHLPPGLPHCLENTGSTAMRVLGVFHPADSPAAKLGPAGE